MNVRLENVPGLKERIMESAELKAAAQQEEEAMAGAGRVLVRASGTEPLIRIMVEAKTQEIAQACAERLAALVNSLKK